MSSDSASTTYARFRASSFFPSINGVRALCALLVIKEHAGWRLPAPKLVEWGFLGVDMFFVISGFLIVTLLLRERDATGDISLRSFYVRRTLRIFPIYYLVIGLLFLAAAATYSYSSKTWDMYKWSIPVFMLYAQDLIPVTLGLMFHTWSLAMEEQFYLFWPAMEKFLRRSLVVPALLALIVLNQLVNFGVFADAISAVYGPDAPAKYPVFLITFTPILLGVLAAHCMHDERSGRWITAILDRRGSGLVLLVAAGLVCEFAPTLQGAPRLAVHVLFCLLLLTLVLRPQSTFARILAWRPLAYLGTISYGVYLYHTFVLFGVDKLAATLRTPLSHGAVFWIVTAISVALAGLSFRYIEKPIMRLRRRPPVGDTTTMRLHAE